MANFRNLFISLCFTVFLVSIVYFNYPQKDSFSIWSRKISSNLSTEAILETIPNCTEYDRDRQRALLIALQGWIDVAEKHQIQYWLAFGSLVGYVQRRGLLPHDPDIDILILSQETSKLEELSKTNFSSEFHFHIQPQWRIVGYENRSYFRDQGIHFVAPNARFYARNSSRHVDIWPVYDSSQRNETKSNDLASYDTSYNLISLPKNWTFPLKKCYFSLLPVWCPAHPELLVTQVYGKTALNKSDTSCVNGTWV